MNRMFSLTTFFFLFSVIGFAQNNPAPLGLWKNAGKNTSVNFLLEAGGKGAEIVVSTASATDKCNCVSTMKFPFKWFVSHDTLFLMYNVENSSVNVSASAKPGIVATANDIDAAKSFCLSPVQFVFTEEKSEYTKTPNRRGKFSIAGNTLTYGGAQYLKE